MILLNTCNFLWLADESFRLPQRVRDALRMCPASERFVSAVSAFEIGYKSALGKLSLPLPAAVWFEESLAKRGIGTIPITSSLAMRASQVPRHHRDPADRFIIAAAREFQAPLLNPDQHFSHYDVEVIWE